MQGNTMVIDSYSKDFLYVLVNLKKKKTKVEKKKTERVFISTCVNFCQIWFDSAGVDENIICWILSVYMRCTFLVCA